MKSEMKRFLQISRTTTKSGYKNEMKYRAYTFIFTASKILSENETPIPLYNNFTFTHVHSSVVCTPKKVDRGLVTSPYSIYFQGCKTTSHCFRKPKANETLSEQHQVNHLAVKEGR